MRGKDMDRESLWVAFVKLSGVVLIVALIGGACWSGWGSRPATQETEGQALLMALGCLLGAILILLGYVMAQVWHDLSRT